jgi:hypothetical protein
VIGALLAAAVCTGDAVLWRQSVECGDAPCVGARVDDYAEIYRCVHGACGTQVCTGNPGQICPRPPLNQWVKVTDTRVGCNRPPHDDIPEHICVEWPFLRASVMPTPGVEYDYAAVVYDAQGRERVRSHIWSCVQGPVKCYAGGREVSCL